MELNRDTTVDNFTPHATVLLLPVGHHSNELAGTTETQGHTWLWIVVAALAVLAVGGFAYYKSHKSHETHKPHESHEPHDDHHHHHHHHHDEGEAEEYGIGTFVYYARRPFDLGLFDDFVARKWPKSIIRAKGICYFKGEEDICYVFEQAGRQVSLRDAGQWYATMPKDELDQMMAQNPQLRNDWDDQYGDRMQKLVFIGQHLDKDQITEALDFCLI
jgi:G3E family GTPase